MSAPFDNQPEPVSQQPQPAESACSAESGRQKALTGIPLPIHCPPPSEGSEIQSELEELEVQQFIDTAAEIAFSIARRKEANQHSNAKILTSRSEAP